MYNSQYTWQSAELQSVDIELKLANDSTAQSLE